VCPAVECRALQIVPAVVGRLFVAGDLEAGPFIPDSHEPMVPFGAGTSIPSVGVTTHREVIWLTTSFRRSSWGKVRPGGLGVARYSKWKWRKTGGIGGVRRRSRKWKGPSKVAISRG
jgi:hypothetical protein